MRKTSDYLDLNLELQADPTPVSSVTKGFVYETTVVEPTAGPTATLGGLRADVVGNIGDAVFTTDAGNDLIIGTDADDILYGGGGNDLMSGGLGNDTLYGGDDHDTLLGQEGNDTLHGENGADWLLGGAGDDILIGGAGDDTLEGGIGNDRLEGGPGNDILKGGDGNDVLVAGSGSDVMIGGAGRDTFVVQARSPYQYGPIDRITDFEVSIGTGYYPQRDVIDLGEALKGSTFTGTTAVEAFQQGYIYLVQHGTPGEAGFGTTVYMDRNGHAQDYGYYNDVALVELEGVVVNSLHVSYYNSNFIV